MITKEFRSKVRKYFYYYKNLLGIPNYWHVRISIDSSIKIYAQVEYDFQEKLFSIKINPKLNKDLPTLKDSILHELIHVLFTPGTSRLDLMLQKISCGEKFNVKRAKKNLLYYEEELVDKLTKIIIKQESYK